MEHEVEERVRVVSILVQARKIHAQHAVKQRLLLQRLGRHLGAEAVLGGQHLCRVQVLFKQNQGGRTVHLEKHRVNRHPPSASRRAASLTTARRARLGRDAHTLRGFPSRRRPASHRAALLAASSRSASLAASSRSASLAAFFVVVATLSDTKGFHCIAAVVASGNRWCRRRCQSTFRASTRGCLQPLGLDALFSPCFSFGCPRRWDWRRWLRRSGRRSKHARQR